MQAFLFYLSYPFIYLFSLLPFRLLYFISDILYIFIYYIFRYRRQVVKKNLQNSFPERSEQELLKIEKEYYHFLCDLVILSIKSTAISKQQILKRCHFLNPEVVEQYKNKGRKIMFVLGHYGEWEISGSAFGLYFNIELVAAFKPLTNPYYNNILKRSRSRFGNRLIPKRELLRFLLDKKNDTMYLALIADQSPNPKEHFWVDFLNQKTAVVTGVEKIARQYDFVVVYAGILPDGRGKSNVRMKILTDHAAQMPVGELTKLYMHELEIDIQKNPAAYLWSHRRWKLTERLDEKGSVKSA